MGNLETGMGGPRDSFPETVWSSVLSAGNADSPERRARLNELCAAYWRPVYKFVRAAWGKTVEDAKDLTQTFFCHVLETDVVARYRRDQGRFRHFLKAVLRNFLTDAQRGLDRLKRGGGATTLSIDVGPVETEKFVADLRQYTPDEIFDRQWMHDVVEESIARLEETLKAEGRGDHFQVYEAYELAGDASATYESVARSVGLSVADVKNRLEYVRLRLRQFVTETVSRSVASAGDLQAEMRDLFSGLVMGRREIPESALGRVLHGMEDPDARIGSIAVVRGWVTSPQIEDALREQAELRVSGREVFLGQILLKRGLVDASQLKELADDLKRHLAGEPIVARPLSMVSRVGRKLRRHVAASVAAAVVLVVLLGALAVYVGGKVRKAREMARLEYQAASADSERAIELWAQLQAMGHPRAAAELDRARRRRAQVQVAVAREHLRRRDDARERAVRLGESWDAAELGKENHVWTAAERGTLWDLQDRLRSARLEERQHDTLAEQAAQTALRFHEDPDARRILASVYFDRWRDAEARRDADDLKLWRPLVLEHGGGDLRGEIEKPAMFDLDAPGAEAYLFRYEEVGRRLMPVPWNGPAPAWPSVEPLPPDAPPERKHEARRATAYPLICSDANRVTFPISVPAGSYLVLLRGKSGIEVRCPVWLERGEEHRARIELPAEIPEGCAYVPPGPAILGQDPVINATSNRYRQSRRTHVDGFFIAKFETTFGHYAEYLEKTGQRERWPRDARGNPIGDVLGDFPVCGVTWPEAAEYAEWLTRTKGAGKWRFRLPTPQEWEKAARGADGRIHVWGDPTEMVFYTCAWSRGNAVPIESIGLYPADESPFDVRDMAGGRREWTIEDPGAEMQKIRGGSWGAFANTVRAASATVGGRAMRDFTVGFRLAAERVK